MHRFLPVLLLLLVWSARPAAAQSSEGVVPGVSDVRFQRGDDPQWARPGFDDRSWPAGALKTLPSRDGIYWLRFRVKAAAPSDAVSIAVVASYDLYWDGRLIGRNGRVGATAAAEEPGALDSVFPVPDDLNGPGQHLVALRVSSFHTGFPAPTFGVVFRMAQLRELTSVRARTMAAMMLGTGGALLVGLVFALFWFVADRRPAVGWFALACLGAGLERGLQAWRWVEPYSYDWHYPRLLALTWIATGVSILRVTFMLSFFQVRRPGIWFGVLLLTMAVAWTLSPFYNTKGFAIGCCALGMSLVVTIKACREKQRGAGFVLASLIVSCWGLVNAPADFVEQSFIYNSGTVILGCVAALTLQLRDERRAAQASQLAAARLEVELLKKNLQPHYLLNTLATIVEMIEQEPKSAVTIIEALAREFRILARVSGEKLIALAHELELCRAHLRIMSLRKGAQCVLEVAPGTDERLLVPPALLHTLVENGLTHLLPDDGWQRFELGVTMEGQRARFTLVAHGQPIERNRPPTLPPLPATPAPFIPAKRREGTGLRYVKARLGESFPGCWSLHGEAVPEGWRTVIEIEGIERVPVLETKQPYETAHR